MAFEYYMLYSLFTHTLSDVVANIKQFERYGYDKIPVHFEEAVMLVMAMNPEYPLDLGKYRISEQTKKKFLAYSKILMKHKRDRVAAQSDLFKDFGNTFWYYIHYVSPITTNRRFYGKTN